MKEETYATIRNRQTFIFCRIIRREQKDRRQKGQSKSTEMGGLRSCHREVPFIENTMSRTERCAADFYHSHYFDKSFFSVWLNVDSLYIVPFDNNV